MPYELSYYHKPRASPLDSRLLHDFIDEKAATDSESEALVFYAKNKERSSLSYSQYKDKSECLAISLLQIGLNKGDRVLLIATNCLEYPVCMMALSRIGACALLMTSHGRTEFNETVVEQLRKWNIRGVICGVGEENAVKRKLLEGIRDLTFKTAGTGQMKGVVFIENNTDDVMAVIDGGCKVYSYNALIHQGNVIGKAYLERIHPDPDEPAFVTFTSGTTGIPKATVISSYALVNGHNLEMGPARRGGSGGSASGSALFSYKPMSVSSFLPVFAMAAIRGCRLVSIPYDVAATDPTCELILSVIAAERCSSCSLPLHFIQNLAQTSVNTTHPLPNVTTFGFGSQFVPRKVISSLLELYPGKRAIYLYAATETFAVAMQLLSNQTVNQKDYGVLSIVPDIEVKVVDEAGQTVAMGTTGQILARGPRSFLGYLDDSVATYRAITPAGWIRTGDYGLMPAYGKLKLLGRKANVIRRVISEHYPITRGNSAAFTREERNDNSNQSDSKILRNKESSKGLFGTNKWNDFLVSRENCEEISTKRKTVEIFPIQVEEILQEHPQITSAAAVGIPDGTGNDTIYACVVPVPGCDMKSRLRELEGWCEARRSTAALKPDYFIFLDELPIARSLKVDRQAIKQLIIKSIRSDC